MAGKDMKDVIAQFQKANKGNINLRPTAGGGVNKPKPPGTGQKFSTINEKADAGNDTAAKQPRTPTSDNHEVTGKPTASEAANPFKVALKPVAKPTGSGVVAARNSANQKPLTEGDRPKSVASPNDETPETAPKVSTSIANKSKMFETQQKQPEAVTPSTPAACTKPKFPANSNCPKSPVVPKPCALQQTKPTPATADTAQKLNGTAAPSANKWKKVESKPDESKPADRKQPDFRREFPLRKGVQDETKTGSDAEADNKVGSTNFATVRPVKSTANAATSIPLTSNTLPKQPKPTAAVSKITKASKEPETDEDDAEQPKVPPKPAGKADQPKIPARTTTEDSVQPKIPPRSSEKIDQPKMPAKTTTEDVDQPKIPLRREQKKPDESSAAAAKHPPPANRKAEEDKPKKATDAVYDKNANKVGGKGSESLPRNMGRPLPKPADKQYRLLPVPKQKGKPPKKKAKPATVDLSKYATYATPKSVQPHVVSPEESYDDGDDIYEDCDEMAVTTKQSTRISEYTEEEEEKLEKKNAKQTTTTTSDNYGKMFNAAAPSVDEYDDDEIYQEID